MGGRSFAGSPVLLFFPRSDNQRLRASLSGSERKQAVEKALIDHLGLGYLHAHQIATRAEQAAARASGSNLAGLSLYAGICQKDRR